MTNYIVSDWTNRHTSDGSWQWRAVMHTNSITAARKFAGPESIVTEHSFEDACAIYNSRVLPEAALARVV